jgi:hypothetical protein
MELRNVYEEYLLHNSSFVDRLDAHLTAAGTCKKDECVNPTSVLHPAGDAMDFFDTLDQKFDKYYSSLEKFKYMECLPYPSVDNEVGFRNLTYVPPDTVIKKHAREVLSQWGVNKFSYKEKFNSVPIDEESTNLDITPLITKLAHLFH